MCKKLIESIILQHIIKSFYLFTMNMMSINVRQFVYENITPYDGDASFLSGPTERTNRLMEEVKKYLKEERDNNGLRSADPSTISTITSHKPGYIDRDLETIVWLQTDEPLKRAIKPFGWVRVVEKALNERWIELDSKVKEIFKYAKNHNDAVFSAYDPEIRTYRSKHVLTWLPDNYARGRIIWDYRRLALYGTDKLIEEKKADFLAIEWEMDDAKVRLREEISMQISALNDIAEMAKSYWFDVTRPAESAQEAIQWVYFAYLAWVKEQDWAAMSLGNVSSFLDIFIEKDLKDWKITEEQAQEMIDHFVMKLRLVRHLRMWSYDDVFGWDPTWVTESVGGMFSDGKVKVTKTSFRFLQTLYNLWPSPEPNLTVLWSDQLPEWFKKFCAQVSIDTSSIQYENDDLMRPIRWSDDYGIACCVSYQEIGKRIQHFGARCNLAKTLLLAINGGREEDEWVQVMDASLFENCDNEDGTLNYEKVYSNFEKAMANTARVYAKAMYIIHYMHDKYYYEKAQMAFIDSGCGIDIAYGIAGMSVVLDSLSAIKYAKVKAVRDENWIAKDFEIDWDYPMFGNDDDRVDLMWKEIQQYFMSELSKHRAYKDATPTLSLLTITSNVMYWKNTWATPDGRKAWEPFAPGANPMHWRDHTWAIASLNSVAKLDYNYSKDGISNTFSIVPTSLGTNKEEQVENLVGMLNWYFKKNAHHLNVNVLNRETLMDAYEHPENYPSLTIRVSWYAVNFVRLSKAHQLEVIQRTFHERM